VIHQKKKRRGVTFQEKYREIAIGICWTCDERLKRVNGSKKKI